MEEILTGIVISSKDYKEKDKIITLFSVEKGLVNLILKGVKNPKAKLKASKELFCFGKYNCIFKSSNLGTVIGCDIIDNFTNLSQNIDKYLEACSILSTVKQLNLYGQADVQLFLELMNTLKILNYENNQKNIVLCKYLIDIFTSMGYKLNLNYCSACYNDLSENIFLNMDTGEITCELCQSPNSIKIDKLIHKKLCIIANEKFDKLCTINIKNIDEVVSVLMQNYEYRFNKKIFSY